MHRPQVLDMQMILRQFHVTVTRRIGPCSGIDVFRVHSAGCPRLVVNQYPRLPRARQTQAERALRLRAKRFRTEVGERRGSEAKFDT
jgi:hypothetical protein